VSTGARGDALASLAVVVDLVTPLQRLLAGALKE
jgi:hypothetical protein